MTRTTDTNPMNSTRAKRPSPRPDLWSLVFLAILIAPSAEARENSRALEAARALNKAFVEVAEVVSSSVVVIEVAQRAEAIELDEDNPLFEKIPKEYRKELL